jgi:hypothetical protein
MHRWKTRYSLSGVLCCPATWRQARLWRLPAGPLSVAVTGGPGILHMWSVVAYFALDSVWASEVREFGEESVDRCAASDVLDAGDQRARGFGRHRQRSDPVQKAVFRQSTRRPECEGKSTPTRGCVKSATTNRHVKYRRSPRLRGSHQQVWIVVPLAAQRS